jgi:MFS family permease
MYSDLRRRGAAAEANRDLREVSITPKAKMPGGMGIWLTLAGLGMSNVVEQMDRYVFQVAPIPYVDYNSYTYSLLAGTLFSTMYCVGNLTFSVWNEYLSFNRVTVVAVASLFSSLALFCVPFVQNFWQLGLLRVLMGISQSPITTFSSSLIKDCFIEELRGVAFGLFDSGTFFGFAFSLTVGTIIYDRMGWQAPYIIFGLIGVAYAFLLKVVAKDPDAGVSSSSDYGAVDTDSSQHASLKTNEVGISSPFHDGKTEERIEDGDYGDGDNQDPSSSHGNRRGAQSCETNMIARKIYAVAEYSLEYPSIILMCIACLIRFCGGYCYAYYVAIFFSELYRQESPQGVTVTPGATVSCTYSYEGNSTATSLACGADYPYCMDSACSRLNPTPWHNIGMDHSEFETAFAAATSIGSVLGCMVGGYVGDFVSKNTRFGVSGRLLVAGLSLWISGPMYLVLYTQPSPLCFVGLALGGLFGEVYYAQAMAVLAEMVPKRLFTVMTSVYISLFIGVGSNATLFVPLLRSYFDTVRPAHTFTVLASSTFSKSSDGGLQSFTETIPGAMGLQDSLSSIVLGTYMVGGLLFLICVPMVARDLTRVVKE